MLGEGEWVDQWLQQQTQGIAQSFKPTIGSGNYLCVCKFLWHLLKDHSELSPIWLAQKKLNSFDFLYTPPSLSGSFIADIE